MIPDLVKVSGAPWKVLPPGVHFATLKEVREAYGYNATRRRQFEGLAVACEALSKAGCETLYLDGSFVTGKPRPGDYDACWDPKGVSPVNLHPVFLIFDNKREAQKREFLGEFFPFGAEAEPGVAFLDFFQKDRFSGMAKGIIAIDLSAETFGRVTGVRP
jgi:hypothetical protein